FRARRQIAPRLEAGEPFAEISNDLIEADAPQPKGGFAFAPGVCDHHDRPFAVEDCSRPTRILAPETDVDAAREMSRREFRGIARVEQLGADFLQRENGVD